ncbi:MAG: hypothetical protein L0338_28215 [Acidobacteria bacterium]|nr:hypothetical protein [Acidobacteriota bacterium]
MARPKYRPPRKFYFIPTILVAAVLIFTALSLVYDLPLGPEYLSILHAILSLAIVLFTFGLLGDSEAAISSGSQYGLEWQAGGSFAGLLILFALLSWGLSPYRSLTVHLLKQNGDFLGRQDGPVDVVIASEVKRSVITTDGQAVFAYLPRSEEWRIHISGAFMRRGNVLPEGCLLDDSLISRSWRCRTLRVTMTETFPCLTDLSIVVGETEPTNATVRGLLEDFKEDMEEHGEKVSIRLNYSDEIIKRGLHERSFKIHRRTHARKACDALADIEHQFNLSNRNSPIRFYATCSAVYVALSSEAAPSGDYRSCSQ